MSTAALELCYFSSRCKGDMGKVVLWLRHFDENCLKIQVALSKHDDGFMYSLSLKYIEIQYIHMIFWSDNKELADSWKGKTIKKTAS